jgi:hypothetical protein
MGHRMHRRSRLVRTAARRTRPTGAWDPEEWAEKHLNPGHGFEVPPLIIRAGRKNHPPPDTKKQQPKQQGRGGRGGKGGGGKK